MKKVLSLIMAVSLVLSLGVSVYAEDYKTTISHVGDAVSEYIVAVPEMMAPGGSSVVSLEGTWTNQEEMVVSAPNKVTLTSDIDGETKDLGVTFGELRLRGDNNNELYTTKEISVDSITGAIFGRWEGSIVYNVRMEDINSTNLYIPEGAIYYSGVSVNPEVDEEGNPMYEYVWSYDLDSMSYEHKYEGGDAFPELRDGDIYVYDGLQYSYNREIVEQSGPWRESEYEGWGVTTDAVDSSWLPSYPYDKVPFILSYINGEPVVSMDYAFYSTSLMGTPNIPETILTMQSAFEGATIGSSVKLPSGVINITLAFASTNLKEAPYIPSSVKMMDSAFIQCYDMVGSVKIDATPSSYSSAFWGTGITEITGACPDNIKSQMLADMNV